MLVDKFVKFLESLENNSDSPYVDDMGDTIVVDGHIPRDKLEKFLKGLTKQGAK